MTFPFKRATTTMMPSPTTMAPDVLNAPVAGRNLRPGTLRDQLGPRPTLLVFLRHFGCPFTREWLADLVTDPASGSGRSIDPADLLFIHHGTAEQGDAYFARFAPDARAVADPDQRLYRAFGLPRAPKTQLLDPRVWACGLRSTVKGFWGGGPIGDPFALPGLLLLDGDQVTWRFDPKHMGERPALAGLATARSQA